MHPNNPMLNQQMALLDQEYAQKKANLMQNFIGQPQMGSWGQQNAPTQQTAQPTQNQNVDWIHVSGIEGAKNQIVQPGQIAWMMDNNGPYIYVKSVNKFGSPEFRAFFIQEAPKDQINRKVSPIEQPQIDLSGYVQRSEFDALKAQLEEYTSTQSKRPQKGNKEVVNNG